MQNTFRYLKLFRRCSRLGRVRQTEPPLAIDPRYNYFGKIGKWNEN